MMLDNEDEIQAFGFLQFGSCTIHGTEDAQNNSGHGDDQEG